jgi:hypothetical protein
MIVSTIADLTYIAVHCDCCPWSGTADKGLIDVEMFVRCPRCQAIVRTDVTRTQRTTDRVLYTPTKARKA